MEYSFHFVHLHDKRFLVNANLHCEMETDDTYVVIVLNSSNENTEA